MSELQATAIGRLCTRCGSSAHGRPWVRVASGDAPSVSLAYAKGVVVVAWSWDGEVGVDVERSDADAGAYGEARTWTRAEAVLKATGAGLSQDPADAPVRWARQLDLGPTYAAHVAMNVSAEQVVEVDLHVDGAVGRDDGAAAVHR